MTPEKTAERAPGEKSGASSANGDKPDGRKVPDQEAPAADEVSAEPQEKAITVQGIEFILPAKQPFRTITAARGIIRAKKTDDREAALVAMIDTVEAFIGVGQMERVNDLDAEDGFKAMEEILEKANAAYGSAEGESSASPSS